MTSGTVERDQDGPVAVLTLSRPKKLNAVDAATLAELDRALADADADPAIRVVERMRGMAKPVIAAVNGYAFGGGMVLARGWPTSAI